MASSQRFFMPIPEKRVLVVDDDPDLRDFLCQELASDGHACFMAGSGSQALNLLRGERWDLVLLDWTLPDLSGVDVCRLMRKDLIDTPVIMLTAHDDVQERVHALDSGADDYLTKPFEIDELLARVRAHLRRGSQSRLAKNSPLQFCDLELIPASREVRRSGKLINLTGREFDLIHLLLKHPGRVHERRQILEAIWGQGWVGDDNVLDVYIRSLRRKIEPVGAPTLIQTVRGVGFILKAGDLKSLKI